MVISPVEMNKYLNTVVIAPMTSQSKKYPTRVSVKHNRKSGWIVLDQIRTIDKQRIIKALDVLTEKEIQKVKQVMKAAYFD